MKIRLDNQNLLDLIKNARNGKIVLPQFQRNFVWSRDDITALLISILQGHFIGAFLFLDTDKDNIPFAIRAIEGIDLPLGDIQPEIMILDGQQRLTSLHYAFAAPSIPLRWTKYPYRFFINLNNVNKNDLEEMIISERVLDCEKFLNQQNQFETLIIPFTELENSDKWLNSYEQWLVKKDKNYYFDKYFPEIKPIWIDLFDRIKTFTVPTITIPKVLPNDSNSLAEVCAIFEKINSMGVKLSVYDLLTARLYKDRIDLHKLWDEASNENLILNEYSGGSSEEFGVYILRTLSLIRGLDVKSKTLINLSPENFERDWKLACKYLEKALERMTSIGVDGFGVFNRKWMPYLTMVSPLAAMLFLIDKKKLDHKSYRWIQRWYWASIFQEGYAGSIESIIYRDFQDFHKSNEDSSYEAQILREARINIIENKAFTLQNINRLNSIYRGIICIIALRGAKDFRADDGIVFHNLEDHHIFPVAYLNNITDKFGKKISIDRINCVINRTLISDQTNKQISKRNPSNYIKSIIPASSHNSILDSHFIDKHAQEALASDDFEQFLKAREASFISEISRRLLG